MADIDPELPSDHSSLNEPTLEAAIIQVLQVLGERAHDNAQLRQALGLIGQTLLALAEPPPDCAKAVVSDTPDSDAPPPTPTSPSSPSSPPATLADLQRFARVMMGQELAEEEPPKRLMPLPPLPPEPLDLQEVVDRCQAKQGILAWCSEHPSDPPPHDMVARAKSLPHGQTWMLRSDGSLAIEQDLSPMLAGTLAATAAISATLVLIDQHALTPSLLKSAIDLAAETQSALRGALRLARVTTSDYDQLQLFQWLRERANEEGIYIPRYMRKNDPADPLAWQERLERVRQFGARVVRIAEQRRRQRKLLSALRYRLRKEVASANEAERVAAWLRVGDTLDQLIESGLPTTHPILRPILGPYLTTLPPTLSLPPRANSAIEAVSLYRANGTTTSGELSEEDDDPIVGEVAGLLHDQTVVMLGGERRPYTAQAIKEAFTLRELIWCTTQEGQSYLSLEPYIRRPDVTLVILAIRWASHNLSEATNLCTRYNKLLVRLPAGYNASQMAHQIMQQVGDRLHALAAERES